MSQDAKRSDIKLSIVQICYSYPPNYSGYGRQLDTVNRYITKKWPGVKITIITAFKSDIQVPGITLKYLFNGKRDLYRRFEKLYFLLFCLWFPIRYCSVIAGADAIHVVKARLESAIAVILAKIFNVRIIVKVVQSEFSTSKLGHSLNGLVKWTSKIIRHADYIVALSDEIHRDLIHIQVLPDKIVKLPNAVDTERYRPVDPWVDRNLVARLESNTKFRVLFVGAISRRKGVPDLIAALKHIDEPYAFEVCLVGPTADFSSLEEDMVFLSSMGLSVVYKGEVVLPELIYPSADLLVLPSYNEGLPNVVLESLSCGVPALLSDIPVHVELVELGAGRLFKLGDPIDLASKLVAYKDYLKENRATESVRCRNLAVNKFSLEIIAGEYCKLYSNLQ